MKDWIQIILKKTELGWNSGEDKIKENAFFNSKKLHSPTIQTRIGQISNRVADDLSIIANIP